MREVEELVRLGVKAVILFGIPEEKDDEGSGAWVDDGIVQRARRDPRSGSSIASCWPTARMSSRRGPLAARIQAHAVEVQAAV